MATWIRECFGIDSKSKFILKTFYVKKSQFCIKIQLKNRFITQSPVIRKVEILHNKIYNIVNFSYTSNTEGAYKCM